MPLLQAKESVNTLGRVLLQQAKAELVSGSMSAGSKLRAQSTAPSTHGRLTRMHSMRRNNRSYTHIRDSWNMLVNSRRNSLLQSEPCVPAHASYEPKLCISKRAEQSPENRMHRTGLVSSKSHMLSRRSLLSSLTVSTGAVGLLGGLPGPAVASETVKALQQRVLTQGDLTSPGNSIFKKPGLILYPRWLFGDWEVHSRFSSFRVPLGLKYVDPALVRAAEAGVEAGGLGSEVTYGARWYSTLPDTWENKLRVFGGSLPEDAIIADRAYNIRQSSNAYLGTEAVQSVDYETRDNPDRATVNFAGISEDMGPLPPRRAELFLNNVQSEAGDPSEEGQQVFVTSELMRQVMLGVRQADVNDYEVLNMYQLQADGQVKVRQRTALYLEPRDNLYFQAGGRAIAIYDYDLVMKRKPLPEDAPSGAIACVATPKGYNQCL